ncbi:MAG: protein-export chaperone SecB [Flavobacteriales bacterium]|nr:protein-export chaperone SecB [Flavobacteriales bacterium]
MMDSQSGYQTLAVALIESEFKRTSEVHEGTDAKPSLHIDVTHGIDGDDIRCNVELKYSSSYEGNVEVRSRILMQGVFKQVGNPELPIEAFAKTNAPAIVFPFLREHLASQTLKALLRPVVLPPVNIKALSSAK